MAAQTKDGVHPQPVDATLTISDEGIAQINWNAPDQVSGVVFFEGFESPTIPDTWALIDNDGDGEQWETHPANWSAAHGGEYSIASYSWFNGNTLTPDNWIISPAIELPENAQLRFFVSAISATYPAEHYQIKISTTNAEMSSFTETIFEETLTNEASQWQQRDIDLSEFANQTVYLAIVHNQSTNQFALKIDDFIIHTTPQTKETELNGYAVYRIYETGEPQLIKETEPTITEITDTITLEGYYTYTIEAQYSDNESSNGTQTNTALYIDWLPAPENFQAISSGNLVELNWGPASNHSKTLISDGFEAPTNLTQWVNLDFDNDQASWEIHTATAAYEGSQSIASYSWLNGEVLTPNNWLISPNIPVRYAETLNLSWAVAGINASHSNEYYQIRTATKNSDTTLFAISFDETLSENDATWKERTLNLNQYIGDTVSVALVHQRSTDVFGLKLDNVVLNTSNSIEGYKLYRKLLPDGNIELVELTSGVTTSFTDTLQSSGNYSYLISAIYNNGGEGKKTETEPIHYNAIGDLSTNIVKIFPNPTMANKNITIVAENRILELIIIDSKGITVEKLNNINTRKIQLNSTFKAGLYFVKCIAENGTTTEKLLIK